ncbi:MAG: 4Fe-4S binding protein, partial [Treponema sp.]|nr:4Fe-4S binding protein [Treponema sp.]
MGKNVLAPVIQVDENKCTSCQACVNACPVKFCMDSSGDKLVINPDLCLGCGSCIAACTHEARLPLDDISRFFKDLKQGEKIIAIAAPSVASVFPGKYLNLNGYLKFLGVETVFDVSFGAELTVLSYINYIKEKNPRMVIAQPCPAIVTYIEIYHPELLPYLSPMDSPMLHSIKMIREYYPQYRNYRIAVISPCVAKRREFDETGHGDYNVTMLSLKKYLEEQKIDLSQFPELDYSCDMAERAVQFSSPGGLLDTAERFIPGIRRRTRKIEGVHAIYPYLKDTVELLNRQDIQFPLLVDCLNCEKGCNGGPGTGNNKKPIDELETPILKRSAELEKQNNPMNLEKQYKKYHKILNSYWKKDLYKRSYLDLSKNNTLKQPGKEMITRVYHSLGKFNPEDIYNCTSCGYGSCEDMAFAIFNNLNKPENCAHYNLFKLEQEKKSILDLDRHLKEHIDKAFKLIEGINSILNDLDTNVSSQAEAIDHSTTVTEKMVDALKTTSEHSSRKQESIKILIDKTARSKDSMQETIASVKGISQSVDDIS